jgi:hypothetical protein
MPPPKTRMSRGAQRVLETALDPITGEDTRTMLEEPPPLPSVSPLAAAEKLPPRITTAEIVRVSLRRAPPPLTVEQKRAAFFAGAGPVHAELLRHFLVA